MAMFDDFRDKVVLVTGASSGIGRETALAFGAGGAHVALVARRREALEEVQRAIVARGGKALVAPADVTKPSAVRACIKTVLGRFKRIDVVVNNAGVLIASPVVDLKAADLAAMLKVNLFGALAVMQEAVKVMQRQGDGCIVNVASLAGRRGVTPLGGYCASKFALVGLTEALRTELRGSNVHVALVMPGVIDTPMAHGFAEDAQLSNMWPTALNMPPAWVVWAIFAAARFRLVEVSVPPGAATLEKLAALMPGVADSVIHWGTQATQWVSSLLQSERKE
ncbi:MAG: SDR family oxidoreductase [Deltaproteobacteria bacterium]|nr:SDR family oxidoreductase [Deltaproteobacteria bacterium]MBI3388013.1 SDR family oxidoreductase [Deltaproteobacteria bacterium]